MEANEVTTCGQSLYPNAYPDSGQFSDESGAAAPASTPIEPPAKQQPRKRGGAPHGNANAATHGMKGSKFPPGANREQATVLAIVRAAKAACESQNGHPVTVHQNAVLHRLRRAATKDRLAARWLRLEADKLTIEQRMALTDAMSDAAEAIEKCLRQLGLDGRQGQAPAADWSARLRNLDTKPPANATPAAASTTV